MTRTKLRVNLPERCNYSLASRQHSRREGFGQSKSF